jgi:hypothetical protein
MARITMLGTGLIGMFYTRTLHGLRGRDRVVNAIIDSCYRSMKSGRWEPVELAGWRGKEDAWSSGSPAEGGERFVLIKREKMPDGRAKLILKERETGRLIEKIEE